jgi:uncharacterized coiled-coil protein SlyX
MAKAKTPKRAAEMTIAALRKAIEFHKCEIAKHRDALRDLLEDAAAVEGSATDAIEYMESAVDKLSEYV